MIQDSMTVKKPEASRFATLPSQLQSQIKRCLELGDFQAAKALFEDGLKSQDKH